MKSKKKNRMKNVILIFVEGESEKRALELPISELFDEVDSNYRVIFSLQHKRMKRKDVENKYDECDEDEYDEDEYDEYDEDEYDENKNTFEDNREKHETGGDITSDKYVNPQNIERKINNRFFKPLLEKEKIYAKDIAYIIQIVDLDGAYISDDRVKNYIHKNMDNSIMYNEENEIIECANILNTQERNHNKSINIDFLKSLEKIKIESKQIPYSIYYFSSNLDHFLHNNANMKRNKVKKATEFLDRYGFDIDKFFEYFESDEDAVTDMNYEESWEFVKKENRSLKRGTNINILLSRIRNHYFKL